MHKILEIFSMMEPQELIRHSICSVIKTKRDISKPEMDYRLEGGISWKEKTVPARVASLQHG